MHNADPLVVYLPIWLSYNPRNGMGSIQYYASEQCSMLVSIKLLAKFWQYKKPSYLLIKSVSYWQVIFSFFPITYRINKINGEKCPLIHSIVMLNFTFHCHELGNPYNRNNYIELFRLNLKLIQISVQLRAKFGVDKVLGT